MKLPPDDASDETRDYLNSLVPGEAVVDIGVSCMYGCTGVVYRNSEGTLCARWDLAEGKMGTSVTWGTRRVSDLTPQLVETLRAHRAAKETEARECSFIQIVRRWQLRDFVVEQIALRSFVLVRENRRVRYKLCPDGWERYA